MSDDDLSQRLVEPGGEAPELRRARRAVVELEASRAALRESEARHRLVVESATDHAIFTTDLDRRVTSWNAGAERVLGWPEEEILGRSADAIFTPEDREAGAPEAEARAALEEGRAEDVRWHLRRDGSRLWANGVMLPLRDDTGAITGLLKILRDKTAEKRAADELRDKAGFLERVLESSADRIEVLDLEGGLRFLSAGALSALEIDDVGAVLGRPWIELWPAEATEAVRAAVEAARAGGTGLFQRFAPTAKGATRWWDVRVTPIPGEGGRPERLLAISRDITERRRAEEALRGSEVRLAAILEDLPIGVGVVDGEGRVVVGNPALRWYVGGDAVPSADGEAHLRWRAHDAEGRRLDQRDYAAARALRGERVVPGIDFLFRCEDGSERWTRVGAVPFRDGEGRIAGALTFVQDIDEAKRAGERLRLERELLDAVIRQAPVGISIAEAPGGRALVLNDKAVELLGHPQPGTDERRYERYGAVHPDGRPYAVEDYPTMRALRSGVAVRQEEMLYRRGGGHGRDGTTRLSVSSAPVRDAGGAVVAAVTVFTDVEDSAGPRRRCATARR